MAHFAEIDETNTVVRVLVVSDKYEDRGQEFLAEDLGLGGVWLKTSYNSRGGIHYLSDGITPSGKPHFRFNFAGPGSVYDPILDAFIPVKPHPNAELNESTCTWILPPEAEIDLFIPDELTE